VLQVAGVDAGLDPDTPLHRVPFVVIDLETTGGSPRTCSITEVGAVRYLAGERVGTFHSLVNPGEPIPRFITHLTGLDDLDVLHAPDIEAVLPSLLEFLRRGVFVAHNARFDFGFVRAACRSLGYPDPEGPPVCTAKLARRVAWQEVKNVRLATLARHFRTDVTPNHRAFPDAEACAGVFHSLLELGGRLGILTLGDLREAMRARGQPHYAKIRLADALPHDRGVYLFRDRDDRVLYVGKATDLRSRVKSYFYGDERKRISDLLAKTRRVEHRVCSTELESLVAEARLIARHEPPYNRRGRTWRAYAYLKVDLTEAWPRLKVVSRPGPLTLQAGDVVYVGPFPSRGVARMAKEAVEDVVPIRRCTRTMGRSTRFSPCVLADLGRCTAPCDGRVSPERYEELVRGLIHSLSSPGGLLASLEARMMRLAASERFEEAATARDRLRALAEAISRRRQDGWLLGAGHLELAGPAGVAVGIDGGEVATEVEPGHGPIGPDGPAPERADELAVVRSVLARTPHAVVAAERPLAEPVDGGRRLADLLARLRAVDRT
jgi:DNA polymerase-3 subunit epsilon